MGANPEAWQLGFTSSHFLSIPCQDISFREGDSNHDHLLLLQELRTLLAE
jgi:hypothetical protein